MEYLSDILMGAGVIIATGLVAYYYERRRENKVVYVKGYGEGRYKEEKYGKDS